MSAGFTALETLSGTRWESWLGCTENQLLRYFEPEPGLFIAESLNVIERALRGGWEPLSFLCEAPARPELAALAAAHPQAERCTLPPAEMQRLRGTYFTGGMLCALRRKSARPGLVITPQMRRVALLEDVENPTNLGAIFRSAAALGVDAVLLTGGCTDPLYRRAARVSMGTVFQVPWGYLPGGVAEGIAALRAQGFLAAAMALRDDTLSIDATVLCRAERLVLVFGNEGYGLTPAAIAACDETVKIPMAPGVDSLNVAASSAVAFWATRSQRF